MIWLVLIWLALIWLALIWVTFFFIKILTFLTLHLQLSTSPNGTNLTKQNFYILFHNNIHILTKRIA